MQRIKIEKAFGVFLLFIFSLPFLLSQELVFAETASDIWHLARWSTAQEVCTVYSPQGQLPDNQTILSDCGALIYNEWLASPACSHPFANSETCSGLFLRKVGEYIPHSPPDETQPPLARFQLDLVNCQPMSLCDEQPEIQLSLITDQPPDSSGGFFIRVGSYEAQCDSLSCKVQLPLTGEQGNWLYYWASPQAGIAPVQKKFLYRAAQYSGETVSYTFDLIHPAFPQYIYPGSDIWEVFPTESVSLPDLYRHPEFAEELATARSYELLCRYLIWTGKVVASHCPGSGLIDGGPINLCGETACAFLIVDVQNQHDDFVLTAAIQHNISARLAKGIIAQESQFIPVSDVEDEFGLGRISWLGFDVILRHHQPYFQQLCKSTFRLDIQRCEAGFESLSDSDREILLGCLHQKVGTAEEIDMISALIKGCSIQVKKMIANVSPFPLQMICDYESLWKLTIANYYSGSGCVQQALLYTDRLGYPLNWEFVQHNFRRECAKAVDYVERVYQYAN